MWDIVSRTPDLTRAVFMVQKEVAERLYAKPGTKDYGALSVWIQSYVRVEWGFVVGPGAFNPPPKVDSAVVTFIPLPRERHPADPKALSSILKLCFQLRRKQLQSISGAGRDDTAAALERLGYRPGSASRDAHAGTVSTACRNFWTFGVLTSPKKHD